MAFEPISMAPNVSLFMAFGFLADRCGLKRSSCGTPDLPRRSPRPTCKDSAFAPKPGLRKGVFLHRRQPRSAHCRPPADEGGARRTGCRRRAAVHDSFGPAAHLPPIPFRALPSPPPCTAIRPRRARNPAAASGLRFPGGGPTAGFGAGRERAPHAAYLR